MVDLWMVNFDNKVPLSRAHSKCEAFVACNNDIENASKGEILLYVPSCEQLVVRVQLATSELARCQMSNNLRGTEVNESRSLECTDVWDHCFVNREIEI